MREISLIFYSDILPRKSYSSYPNQHQWQKRGKVTPAATPYPIALVPEPGHIMKQTHINKRGVYYKYTEIYRNCIQQSILITSCGSTIKFLQI